MACMMPSGEASVVAVAIASAVAISPVTDFTPCLYSRAWRNISTTPSRKPFSSPPFAASFSTVSSAALASCFSMAVASSAAAVASPMPSSSRAWSMVTVEPPPPKETASCSSRFSASLKLPHATDATRLRVSSSVEMSSSALISSSRSITS